MQSVPAPTQALTPQAAQTQATTPIAQAATQAGTAPHLHIPLLGAKVLRIALVWVSAYFAAKTIQDSYIDKVFMKESEPPSLVNMVYTFVMFQAIFSVITIGIVATVLYVTSPSTETVMTFAMASLFDMFVELIVCGGVLFFVARTMEKKKFFNYRYEGLRAIRALRSLMTKISWVTMTIPFYQFFDTATMMATMQKMKQQVAK
jgi:hypothetical protein